MQRSVKGVSLASPRSPRSRFLGGIFSMEGEMKRKLSKTG